jgi:two-component system KDP operon response regulator KdpE
MSTAPAPTLLVTPDFQWRTTAYAQLQESDFTPLYYAPTGNTALTLVQRVEPRLAIVDQHLTDCNIIDFCTEMLCVRPGLKIVLVAEQDDAFPVMALQIGVSGCIKRDFPLAEWSGVLAYVLNGGAAFSQDIVELMLSYPWGMRQDSPLVTVGVLRIDLARRQVTVAGHPVQLTPREFALLACLARNADHVVSFDQLLNEAWGYEEEDGAPAQVRLYVARLRRKLSDEGKAPDFIQTERGVGYRLDSSQLRSSSVRPSQWKLNGLVRLREVLSLAWLQPRHVTGEVIESHLRANATGRTGDVVKTSMLPWGGNPLVHDLEERFVLIGERLQGGEEWWSCSNYFSTDTELIRFCCHLIQHLT